MRTIILAVLGAGMVACQGAAVEMEVTLDAMTEEAFLAQAEDDWQAVAPGVYQRTEDSGLTTTAVFGAEGLAWEREHVLDDAHQAWLDEAEQGLADAVDGPPPIDDPLARTDTRRFSCAGDSFTASATTSIIGTTTRARAYAGRDLNFGPAVPGSYVARSDIWHPGGSGASDADSISNGCCTAYTEVSYPVGDGCRVSAQASALVTYCGGQYASVLVGGSCDLGTSVR